MATEVSEHLDRIENGKTNIVASIQNKGVTVPSDTTIDKLSPYVDAIQTGADVSGVTAKENTVLDDFYFVDEDGVLKEGTIPVFKDEQYCLDLNTKQKDIYGEYHASTNIYIVAEDEKIITPDEAGTTVSPANGRVLSTVKVNPISNTYVGSGVAKKSSSDLTASGATVTAPAGYYASAATHTIGNGSCTVAGGGLTAGAGSVSCTGIKISVTEKSDASDGGHYVKVIGSGSVSRAAITDTHTAGYIPAKSTTNVSDATSLSSAEATKYYKIATSFKTVTPGAASTTVYPDTNTLLTSVTINGDSNLIPAKIKKGETIFGVTGEYEGEGTSLGTDTCTVRLGVATMSYWHPEDVVAVLYKAYENGSVRIKAVNTYADSADYITLSNIICGSEFFVYTQMSAYISPGEYELYSDEHCHCLKCPNTKGQTITINLMENS